MAGVLKILQRALLLCVAGAFGFYCAFVTYRSFLPKDYDMTEWNNHLKQHLYNKSKTFEHLSSELSNETPLYQTFVNCTLKKVRLSTKRLPITGLASFPGSGNTWTRNFIQQMTGLATSSEYCDMILAKHGFPFECYEDRSRVIVVQTYESKFYRPYQKLVLLIRNPFDAFLSMTNVVEVGHTGRSDIEKLKKRTSQMFDNLVFRYISLLGNTIDNFGGPVYILQYDKLKTNMAEELQKLARFLNVDAPQGDIDCTVMLQEGNFHRKGNITEHLNTLMSVYNREQLLTMREVARFSEKLIQRKYGLYLNLGGQTEQKLFDSDFHVH